MSRFLHISILISAIMAFIGLAAPRAAAFDSDTYAQQSVLASGTWVKISVDHSGLYIIPNAALRSWGFSDPSRVRIHGYGGRRIPDALSLHNYIDDLPLTASEVTDAGIVFYAAGPDTWVTSTGQYCHSESNLYSTKGYYFITEAADDSDSPAIPATGVAADAAGAATLGYARLHHEQNGVLASEAGALFVGEDFRFTSARDYDFKTPGKPADEPVWFECQFFHYHQGATATLSFTADGTALPEVSTDRIPATSTSHYVHGSVGTTRHTFTPASADAFRLGLRYTPGRVAEKANLDYISVNYRRRLEMDAAGYVEFWSQESTLGFDTKGTDTRVWDVTDPANVELVNTRAGASGILAWSVSRTGTRAYVAWRPGATLPQPSFAGRIAAQNLHYPSGTPDMIIISSPAYTSQAKRIADLHLKHDSLQVNIVDPELIYNEFSSGTPDVSGIRKYLKMVYDRGNEAGRPLRYVLLMGRATLDHRMILESSRRLSPNTVPWWLSDNAKLAMSDNDGFGTDDFIAMLDDDSGRDLGLDDLSVAVGRIPLLSASEGDELIDKLTQYVEKSKKTGWKNRLIVLADNDDGSVHLQQAERMVDFMLATEGQQHVITKIYIDAYDRIGGTYPDARNEMFHGLDEGMIWWFFTGHASNHAWTGDGMLTFSDINSMYLRNLPFVVASTCDFLRWDSETISGGEIMYKERYGGAIGMISATRPVYIADNDYFLSAMGRNTLARDSQGRLLSTGEVYRRAKNNILNSQGDHRSNTNRLRFVFMGDPAMRPVSPDNIVELLTINGQSVNIDDQITIGALGTATLTGRITAPDGTPLTDFDGIVNVELFDALRSLVTNGFGTGTIETFDTQGDKLYAGSAKVTNGEFTLKMAMPSNVADNFRPATLSMYAYATNSDAEAIGVNRDFYVYGYDEPEQPDTIPPVIDTMYLNHDQFADGQIVNSSPMLIATLSDNVGINLSKAGIGQQISLSLDDKTSYNDVSTYYTPATDGSPTGTLNYPLDALADGPHTLRLTVFDTSGNIARRTISFTVSDKAAPQIFDVFTDANPASTAANFYVRHDRPENILTTTITVYDLMGHPIWESTVKGMSDMDLTTPVTWNLTDYSGRRVQRGIYLYRATITTDNATYDTTSRRIAVTN